MFTEARIKLTAWYVTIIMVISAFFSLTMFEVLSREVYRYANLQEQRWELSQSSQSEWPMSPRYLRVLIPEPDPNLTEELLGRIKFLLLLINGSVLVISGILSYLLAGKTLSPIEEIMADQQRFVTDAGHELKTPVTAVRVGIEVALRDKNLSLSEAKDVLQDCLHEMVVLQGVTQSLLRLSRDGIPDDSYFTEIDLSLSVQKAIKKIRPLAIEKKIEITQRLTKVIINGNESKLTELFVILLDNAIKYSNNNSQVGVEFVTKGKKIMVSVSDQGMGISTINQRHIFDRFYRVDASRTRTDGGHGLGLSIAKEIVLQHGGKISVKSQPNKGSVFIVQFSVGD